MIHGVCWIYIWGNYVVLEKCPKKAQKLGVGEWFVPGGKIESGECVAEALTREFSEEWPTMELVEFRALPVIEGSPIGVSIDDIFLMQPFVVNAKGTLTQHNAEGVELRWVPLEVALRSPVPQVRMMVAGAMGPR